MKLLVAYDGSRSSEAALDDMVRAGIPDYCDALVVSVAEVWLPPLNGVDVTSELKLDDESERSIWCLCEKKKNMVAEAATLANHARKRLQGMFPTWSVAAESTYGSPAWSILEVADTFKPDLIVVGSHGRSAISQLFLGSISQKVLTEASCSVRVARGRIEVDPAPVRIVIGFDGSKGAQAAVESVASRNWNSRTEVRLVAATDEVSPSTIGRFIPPVTQMVEEVNEAEREWVEKMAENALKRLQSSNISATLSLHAGNPKNILISEAEKWNADCIFVGANAFGSRLERFVLGSTSAAVAARAHCSVEVVRQQN